MASSAVQVRNDAGSELCTVGAAVELEGSGQAWNMFRSGTNNPLLMN